MAFDIVDRAAAGRIGRFQTAHGTVTTPTLMPVVNPNIDLVSPQEMRDRFGCEMVITNSYVIHKHDHLREQALSEGVHKVIDWDGPIMTDSGTFQMYVYGDVEVGPNEIVEFQKNMGVDVATCLDLFVTPDMTREEAEHAVATTLERTAAAARLMRGDGESPGIDPDGKSLINATVQGGLHADLRQACAAAYRDLPVEYHTIGGVVPVMERQMYPELVDIILNSQQYMRKDRPVHLFGAGHPLVFPLATALGCDLFDSSSYAKYAKDGRLMTPGGTVKVAELTEFPFSSRDLDKWTPAELNKALRNRPKKGIAQRGSESWEAERAIAMWNLDVCFTDMRRIRQAIRDGVLWELVEQRAACHPMLAAATRRLGEKGPQSWLEEREPTSGTKALRYTGGLTHRRPMFARIHERMQSRVTPIGETATAEADSSYAHAGEEKREAAMHKEPKNKPYGDALGAKLDPEQDHIVISGLGPVPLGLDEAYPFSQSHIPRLASLDPQHMGWVGTTKDAFLDAHDLMPGIPGPGLPGARLDRDFLQVLRTSDYQFGAGAGLALTGAWTPERVRDAVIARGDVASTTPEARIREFAGIDVTGASGSEEGTETESAAGLANISGSTGASDASHAHARPTPLVPLGETVARGDGFSTESSRATLKLRTVALGKDHVLSLRAGDGLWTLKVAGAKILHKALPAPANRVVVHADSVPFNRDGKSVFAQFVLDCDPALRPGDECLVVDEADNLLAVGRALLNREEMQDFQSGVAVKVREGIQA